MGFGAKLQFKPHMRAVLGLFFLSHYVWTYERHLKAKSESVCHIHCIRSTEMVVSGGFNGRHWKWRLIKRFTPADDDAFPLIISPIQRFAAGP